MSALARPELVAPAGDWECLRAAVAAGADAVYFGLTSFNARLRAANFQNSELAAVIDYLHARGRRGYLALNILIFTAELPEAQRLLLAARDAAVDAVILQDLGVVRLARALCPSLTLHASTQMTLTSPEGVAFARRHGLGQAIIAREVSLRELARFPAPAEPGGLPLEVFVHGALCVAYSGQCLTSEVLGRRSANRGECAQACRLPYGLEVDGKTRDLGDRRYLLSPQDLAAVDEIPRLLELGVRSFKIEGRLKSPDYITAVTAVYRQAIDQALAGQPRPATAAQRYRLEMTFSRGLFYGWLHGVDHQQLVHARFGKKRGPLAGLIRAVGQDWIELDRPRIPLRPGDGVVIDTGDDPDAEQGGRLYAVAGRRLSFARGHLDPSRVRPGHRLWKTSDPVLERELRAAAAREVPPLTHRLDLHVSGRIGEPLQLRARAGGVEIRAASALALEAARTRPLDEPALRRQLGRLGGTRFHLGQLEIALEGPVSLPFSELNRLRRQVVGGLTANPEAAAPASVASAHRPTLDSLLQPLLRLRHGAPRQPAAEPARLAVLCRSAEQLEALLADPPDLLYLDFEDPGRFRPAVAGARGRATTPLFLATPRIQKAGETGFFRLLENAAPDGVLLRNLGAVEHFRQTPLRRIGDYCLNIANPLAASVFREEGLERLTISYDLDVAEVLDLLDAVPPAWFELTLHQHIPMFHMEHCVFAAFLSSGSDPRTCGRPCDRHRIAVRDRVGEAHPVQADVDCRNTVFSARPQSGAAHRDELLATGLRHFRLELLGESGDQALRLLRVYRDLLEGHADPTRLARALGARDQLGVLAGSA